MKGNSCDRNSFYTYIPMSPTLLIAVGEVATPPAAAVLRDTAAGGGGKTVGKRLEN